MTAQPSDQTIVYKTEAEILAALKGQLEAENYQRLSSFDVETGVKLAVEKDVVLTADAIQKISDDIQKIDQVERNQHPLGKRVTGMAMQKLLFAHGQKELPNDVGRRSLTSKEQEVVSEKLTKKIQIKDLYKMLPLGERLQEAGLRGKFGLGKEARTRKARRNEAIENFVTAFASPEMLELSTDERIAAYNDILSGKQVEKAAATVIEPAIEPVEPAVVAIKTNVDGQVEGLAAIAAMAGDMAIMVQDHAAEGKEFSMLDDIHRMAAVKEAEIFKEQLVSRFKGWSGYENVESIVMSEAAALDFSTKYANLITETHGNNPPSREELTKSEMKLYAQLLNEAQISTGKERALEPLSDELKTTFYRKAAQWPPYKKGMATNAAAVFDAFEQLDKEARKGRVVSNTVVESAEENTIEQEENLEKMSIGGSVAWGLGAVALGTAAIKLGNDGQPEKEGSGLDDKTIKEQPSALKKGMVMFAKVAAFAAAVGLLVMAAKQKTPTQAWEQVKSWTQKEDDRADNRAKGGDQLSL